MTLKFWIVLLVLFLGTSTGGHAASFDCSKASTETEIAICSNPELSALDVAYLRLALATPFQRLLVQNY